MSTSTTTTTAKPFGEGIIFNVGIYEVSQEDASANGFVVGVLYGRTTKSGKVKREFHSLARAVVDCGLQELAGALLNDYTSEVHQTRIGALLVAERFALRFGYPLFPREADEIKEAKAKLEVERAEKAKLEASAKDSEGEAKKSKAKKTLSERLGTLLDNSKDCDFAKVEALIDALAKYSPDIASATREMFAQVEEAKEKAKREAERKSAKAGKAKRKAEVEAKREGAKR